MSSITCTWTLAIALMAGAGLIGCAESEKASKDGSASKDDGDDEKSKKKKKKKKKKGNKKKAKADASSGADEPKAKNDDGSVPSPKPGEVPELRVGAWSKYKTKTGTAQWGVLEKRAGDEYLIDAEVQMQMRIAIQAWLHVPDFNDGRTSSIKELKYRLGSGAVTTLSGSALKGQSALYGNLISGFMPPKFEGLPQEDVTVAAGTFRGCYKWTSKQTFMGIKSESTVWSHPAVPPPAMVKSVTKEGHSYELIEYGLTGAKKSL